MALNPRVGRLAAVAASLALVAAACGGSDDPPPVERAVPPPVFVTEPVDEVDEAPAPVAEAVAEVAEEPEEPVDPYEVLTVTADADVGTVIEADPAFREIDLYDAPGGDRVLYDLPVINPTWFGTELTLMVTEGDEGDEWVKVQIPVRPNGSEAWINTEGFTFDSHRYRALVDLSEFSVEVFEGEDLIASTEAVIGREAAPTPLGTYFINDKVEGDHGVYGSWILSLSAFSETLETFDNGLPVIAIHGTNSPELVGQALSSGCVRVPDDVIQFLADELPLGTRVDIVA